MASRVTRASTSSQRVLRPYAHCSGGRPCESPLRSRSSSVWPVSRRPCPSPLKLAPRPDSPAPRRTPAGRTIRLPPATLPAHPVRHSTPPAKLDWCMQATRIPHRLRTPIAPPPSRSTTSPASDSVTRSRSERLSVPRRAQQEGRTDAGPLVTLRVRKLRLREHARGLLGIVGVGRGGSGDAPVQAGDADSPCS